MQGRLTNTDHLVGLSCAKLLTLRIQQVLRVVCRFTEPNPPGCGFHLAPRGTRPAPSEVDEAHGGGGHETCPLPRPPRGRALPRETDGPRPPGSARGARPAAAGDHRGPGRELGTPRRRRPHDHPAAPRRLNPARDCLPAGDPRPAGPRPAPQPPPGSPRAPPPAPPY